MRSCLILIPRPHVRLNPSKRLQLHVDGARSCFWTTQNDQGAYRRQIDVDEADGAQAKTQTAEYRRL